MSTGPRVLSAVLILLVSSTSLHSDSLLYVTSLEATKDHERFAGGSACCNCVTEHYGRLPADFPGGDVISVTFFLTMSRSSSYYTRVKAGPTQLKLILGKNEAIATSEQVKPDTELPVEASWLISFPFKPPARVEPGMTWKILDGDGDIYSAVGLYSSDVDLTGLPGFAKVSGCQYSRIGQSSYAADFNFGTRDIETSPDIEEEQGKIRERIYKTAVVEFAERGDLGIPEAGAIIAEWMMTSLNETGAFEVYERISLSMLMEEHQFELSGLMNEETIAEVGRLHGVEAIVTGSLIKFGDIISVTARVIDVETALIIDSADVKVTDINEISAMIGQLAFRLASDE